MPGPLGPEPPWRLTLAVEKITQAGWKGEDPADVGVGVVALGEQEAPTRASCGQHRVLLPQEADLGPWIHARARENRVGTPKSASGIL